MRFSALAAAVAVSSAIPALAISTVSVKGSKMFTSDGKQWFMKGIAYQLTNDDPLADAEQCARDASLMKTLGVNSIRVYHVDPTADHSACMSTLSDAGIYAWIDLDTFSTYIIQQPANVPTWTQTQYDAYAKVMDAFHTYDNVAGFFVGNEVMNSPETSIAAPFVKAAARDMKAYRDNKGYRKFPIGYTAADVATLRPMLQNYLACGSDPADAIDVFGLNAYEWCGNVDFQTSGYSGLQSQAANYSIPIFFSETGCNQPTPRTFTDQAAILGPDMDNTWSGAIIYEWIQEENAYGLISYGPPAATGSNVVAGYTRKGTPTPLQPDFSNLSKQWATLSPTGVSESAYTPSLSAPACPAFTSGAWSVSPNAALPTLGQAYTGSPATTASGSAAAATGTTASSGSSGSSSSPSSSTSSSSTSSTSSSSSSSSSSTSSSGTAASAASSAATTSTKTGAAAAMATAANLRSFAAVAAFVPLIAFF